VVGQYYDAKILEAANVMSEACSTVFMLVGEGFGLDNAAEQIRLSCNLPAVPGFTASAATSMAPLMHQAVPNPIDYQTTQAAWALAEAFPDKVKAAAAVVPNGIPSSIDAKDKMEASYPSAGFKFIGCDQTYQIAGESDWKPFAQRLKDCGAGAVYFNGGENNFENLLDASKQIGFAPIWMVEPVFYTDTFRAWNASGNADSVYVRNSFAPLDDPTPGSATATYVDLVTSNGGDISELGAQAASSFLLWATAANECGANLTRACVMEQLAGVHEWTGGGLHVPTDPGANKPSHCGNVLKLDGTTWKVWSPTQGYADCNEKYLFKIETPVPGQIPLLLNADRIAQQYQAQG
jgi:hypothetical protein